MQLSLHGGSARELGRSVRRRDLRFPISIVSFFHRGLDLERASCGAASFAPAHLFVALEHPSCVMRHVLSPGLQLRKSTTFFPIRKNLNDLRDGQLVSRCPPPGMILLLLREGFRKLRT